MREGPAQAPSPHPVVLPGTPVDDSGLLENFSPALQVRCWEPSQLCVVIGQSNDVAREVYLPEVLADDIPIYRRRSGGGAVVLSPGMLVTSVVLNPIPLSQTLPVFCQLTSLMIQCLSELGIRRLCHRGRSDICMGDKKILGSSLYRNASQVLYHQVLLVDAPLEPMMRYLRHPSREPDYRQGRPHHDFVVSLRGEGYAWSVLEIQEAVQRKFEGWGFGAEGGLGRRKGGRVDSTLPQRFEEP